MGFVYSLTSWKHLLTGTRSPVRVFVDHANLIHYRHPQKITRHMAHYINTLSEYNYILKHLPGTLNRADGLSHRPDYHDGSDDNDQVIALPNHVFICNISIDTLWNCAAIAQENDASSVREWLKSFPLVSHNHHWWNDGRLVVVENDDLQRGIVSQYYDSPTAGHPGATSTLFSVSQDYWWPKMKDFVHQYVWGCATCQTNKADTTRSNPPCSLFLQLITLPPFRRSQ